MVLMMYRLSPVKHMNAPLAPSEKVCFTTWVRLCLNRALCTPNMARILENT